MKFSLSAPNKEKLSWGKKTVNPVHDCPLLVHNSYYLHTLRPKQEMWGLKGQ